MIVKFDHTFTTTTTESQEDDIINALDMMQTRDIVEFGIDGVEFDIRMTEELDYDMIISYGKDKSSIDFNDVEFNDMKKFFEVFEKDGIEKAIEVLY